MEQFFQELWGQLQAAWETTPYACYTAIGVFSLLLLIMMIQRSGKAKLRSAALMEKAGLNNLIQDQIEKVELLKKDREALERENSEKDRRISMLEGDKTTLKTEAQAATTRANDLESRNRQLIVESEQEIQDLRAAHERAMNEKDLAHAKAITRLSDSCAQAPSPIAQPSQPIQRLDTNRLADAVATRVAAQSRHSDRTQAAQLPHRERVPRGFDLTAVKSQLTKAEKALNEVQDQLATPYDEFDEDAMIQTSELASNAANALATAKHEVVALETLIE